MDLPVRGTRQCATHYSSGGAGDGRRVDGRITYGRLLRPEQEPGDAVFAEKVCEDAIRDTDVRVVRWTWRELDDFAPVAARIRRR